MAMQVILTSFNILLAWFIYYRLGKQSVIDDLLKAYKQECKNSEAAMEIIYSCKRRIRQLEEKRETACDSK